LRVIRVVDCWSERRGEFSGGRKHVSLLSESKWKLDVGREVIRRRLETHRALRNFVVDEVEGKMGTEITMEDAAGSMPSQQQQPPAPQGVVLVVLDVNKEISTQALNWALSHVARKGDALRLVGVLSHVLNPSKSLVDAIHTR
jgi:hypothetical protein